MDIQTIDENKQLEEELNIYGLSMESTRALVSILQMINQMGYDPRKIVTELTRIKSVRQTERRLKSGCKMLESRITRYIEIIPLCEQIIRLGIGIGELLAFHAAVIKKTDTENQKFY